MPADVQQQATAIILAYDKAAEEIIGLAVVLQDGKAGTVTGLHLCETHGLRIEIAGHPGYWPIATIKLVER